MEDTKSKQQQQTTTATTWAEAAAASRLRKIDGQNDAHINVIQSIKRNRKMEQPNKRAIAIA